MRVGSALRVKRKRLTVKLPGIGRIETKSFVVGFAAGALAAELVPMVRSAAATVIGYLPPSIAGMLASNTGNTPSAGV